VTRTRRIATLLAGALTAMAAATSLAAPVSAGHNGEWGGSHGHFTSPAANSTLTGEVKIVITPNPGLDVDYVDVWVGETNDQYMGRLTSAPWEVTWDTATRYNGPSRISGYGRQKNGEDFAVENIHVTLENEGAMERPPDLPYDPNEPTPEDCDFASFCPIPEQPPVEQPVEQPVEPTQPPTAPVLTDTAGHAHAAGIDFAVERSITTGYPDGTFRPEVAVTRAQMATFLARAAGLPPGGSVTFPDVPADSTHGAAIAAVATAGWTTGRGDGTFDPDGVVTRGQMATFLSRAFSLAPSDGAPFSDTAESVHGDAIKRVAAAGITTGYADGTFRPDAPVTRGQMATFLMRALDR
jgi:hypothetical protein